MPQIREEGFEVPMIEVGTSGLVSLDLEVPEGLSGEVEAAFRLVDSDGVEFGPALVLNLDVIDQPVENETELLSTLQSMGFEDSNACTKALRQAKGDLNSAAITLLRSARK